MEITPTETGPLVKLQVAAGAALPLRAKLITPAGATALVVPVTVATKVIVLPKVGVPVEVRTTVGVAAATRVVEADATAPTAM